MSSRIRRITKEMSDIEADHASKLFVSPANGSDVTHLKASILGPPGTPYEGGTFMVDIKIPNDYPFRPPIMKFDTKVWHPNISSQTGAICLDTLSTRWSPVMTIRSTLLSLQSLFESPEPKDPQDAEVAKMMINDLDGFNRKAHEWAVRHAGAPHNPKLQSVTPRSAMQVSQSPADDVRRYQGYNRALVDRFVNMGFDVDRVVEAFTFVGIDKNNGLDYELEEAYMGDITARLLGEP
ncbi:ubiquitin-conjugating enzyme/RWD-like protein [Microdochium bolleyi]|uniref:Ubiquitin-conjugating enzyme E2 1 n=1 Tax=Microdochium bolleyi TaxID=196109 RepID=A0A136J5N9_9PEZI|nr:ubiquitin-conjugating enzyme/RWD-like protein [Microdochium bolleyi]